MSKTGAVLRRLLCVYPVLGLAAAAGPPQDTGTPAIFRTGVDVVLVPVVVRDRAGKTLGNLVKDDFQVFDNGKEQAITGFFVEAAGGPPNPQMARISSPAPVLRRHVAYLFDDLNLKFSELVAAKEAVFKHVTASLQAADRVGVFTTSGRVTLEFTSDRAALKTTLLNLMPHPFLAGLTSTDCVRLSYSLAKMIVERQAVGGSVTEDAATCMGGSPSDPRAYKSAADLVQAAAQKIVSAARHNAAATLAGISYAIDRAEAAPGPRALVFISPGFVTPDNTYELMTGIDHAIRARVAIGALDARGVRVPGKLSDISLQVTASIKPDNTDTTLELVDTVRQAATLTELSNGTGGIFVRGINDLVPALGRLIEPPEHVYVLAFSRGDSRWNASYHRLNVKVRGARGLRVTARLGYVMPKPETDGHPQRE